MTPADLIARLEQIQGADRELAARKNHDYGATEDPLSNLRDFGFLGVVVRLGDKMARLRNFVRKGGLQVRDESVRDTLRDLRVYGALAEIMLDEEDEKRGG